MKDITFDEVKDILKKPLEEGNFELSSIITNPAIGEKLIGKRVIGYSFPIDLYCNEIYGKDTRETSFELMDGVLSRVNYNSRRPFVIKNNNVEAHFFGIRGVTDIGSNELSKIANSIEKLAEDNNINIDELISFMINRPSIQK